MESLPRETLYTVLSHLPPSKRLGLTRVSSTYKLMISSFPTIPKFVFKLYLPDLFDLKYFYGMDTTKFNIYYSQIYCHDDWIIIPTSHGHSIYINRYTAPASYKRFIPQIDNPNKQYLNNYFIGYYPIDMTFIDNKYHHTECESIINFMNDQIQFDPPLIKCYYIYDTSLINNFISLDSDRYTEIIRKTQTTIIKSSRYIRYLNTLFDLKLDDEHFLKPYKCIYDNFNNLYIHDGFTNTIKKFDSNGNFLLKITMINTSSIIQDLKFDPWNRLFVCARDKIQIFNTNGQYLFTIDIDPHYIKSIALDSRGNLIVLNEDSLLFFDL